MNRFKTIYSEALALIHDYRVQYHTYRFLKFYNAQKFDDYLPRITSFKKYCLIQPEDMALIFFLMNKEDLSSIEKLLDCQKGRLKTQILDDYDNHTKMFPITYGVLFGYTNQTDLFISKGDSPHKVDPQGNSILQKCIMFDRLEAFNYVMSLNVSLDHQNHNGLTALHTASVYGNVQYTNLLLKAGASPLVPDQAGMFPIHMAVSFEREETFDVLKASLNAVRNVQKARDILHSAAELEQPYMLKKILATDIGYINTRDFHGQTPLHYAVIEGQLECAKVLIDHKAGINLQDNQKRTPLHMAVLNGNLEMCRLLTENNANGDIKDQDGLTPIDIAISDRDKSLIQYFQGIPRYSKHFI